LLGIIEGSTRYLIQFCIKEKSDVHKYFQKWYDEYIVPLRRTIVNTEELHHIFLNADMGECTSNAPISYLRSVGVQLTTICPHTPEQNMVIERVWRTIGESAIAMLLTASLSEIYCQEARSTALYLYNRLPGAQLNVGSTYPRNSTME